MSSDLCKFTGGTVVLRAPKPTRHSCSVGGSVAMFLQCVLFFGLRISLVWSEGYLHEDLSYFFSELV